MFLYENSENGYNEQVKIISSDGEQFDEFSSSVDLYNNILIAGAKLDDDLGNNSGSAYIYEFYGCKDIAGCNYNPNVLLHLTYLQ